MIIVVGESPGSGVGRSTSDNLARLMGVSTDVLHETVAWINLWPTGDLDLRPRKAIGFIEDSAHGGDAVILLGHRVAKAFGLEALAPIGHVVRSGGSGAVIQLIPHTSGRNRWYNDGDHIAEAEAILHAIWRKYR